MSALLGLYAGASSRYLNYYGPPRTIRTIPFDVAARSHENLDLDGKMVFVGGSEPRQSEQQDYFHSIFSQQTGANLSGVEIGATAFANLLEQRSLVPLPMWANLLFVALWGAALGAVRRERVDGEGIRDCRGERRAVFRVGRSGSSTRTRSGGRCSSRLRCSCRWPSRSPCC